MKTRKKLLIILCSLLLVFSGGLSYFIWTNTKPLTAETYESKIQSLITDVRTGHEKWLDILAGLEDEGGTYVDLCAPIYAESFREIGKGFIKEYENFLELETRKGTLDKELLDYENYKKQFETYNKIGKQMIAFADYIELSQYDEGIVALDEMIGLFESLEPLN